MHRLTTAKLLISILSSFRKYPLGVVVLGFALILAAPKPAASQSNPATFLVSASGPCTTFPCAAPVSISGTFTIDLTTGVVSSATMSLIDASDLKSSPLSLPLNLQFQFPPNQTLFFRQPTGSGNVSFVQLIFPFNSFPSNYSGGPLCADGYRVGCPGLSGAAIGPTDQSAALSAVTGGNGDTIILTNGSVSPVPVTTSNPVPLVYQPLVPSATAPGGPAFNLTVNGTGFVSGATVEWNGSARATTFVSSTQLTAAISASDISTASTATITVVNPTPGGGLSNPVFFPITNPTRDVAFQSGTVLTGSSDLGSGSPVAAADFTGTGKLDLISSAVFPPLSGSGNIPYWRGNGDGTFQSPVSLQAQTTTSTFAPGGTLDVAVGDFNGDGRLDVVVVGFVGSGSIPSFGAISFLAGNGDGTFQPPVISTFPELVQVNSGVVLGDFNGDGKLDLVAPCSQVGSVVVNARESGVCAFSGNGDGTFNLAFSRFYYPYTVTSLVLADFNGDGKLDIVGTAGNTLFGANPIYLGFLAGNGDGTFAPDRILYETSDSIIGNSGAVAAADLNHDGKLDLVFIHDASFTCSGPPCSWDADFFPGNGDGTFQPVITAHGFPTSSPPFVGDFNGDGDLDVAALDTVLLLHNGSSTPYPIPQSPSRQIPYVVGDFNGDGRLDLMATFVGSLDSIQPLLQVPPSPDFDVAVSSSSQTVTAGGTATFTVTITSVNGFNGVVTPSQTGFPARTTVSYNPSTVTGSGNIVITITTSTSTPLGTYPLAGSLTSGSIVQSGTLTLVVN